MIFFYYSSIAFFYAGVNFDRSGLPSAPKGIATAARSPTALFFVTESCFFLYPEFAL